VLVERPRHLLGVGDHDRVVLEGEQRVQVVAAGFAGEVDVPEVDVQVAQAHVTAVDAPAPDVGLAEVQTVHELPPGRALQQPQEHLVLVARDDAPALGLLGREERPHSQHHHPPPKRRYPGGGAERRVRDVRTPKCT
jgi:hypothetical protein